MTLHPETLAVCRLAADATTPDWAAGGFTSITRTPDELSVVCESRAVPEGVRHEGGWRALKVAGPLDFALTGVLAALAAPLAEAGIPIFVVSTYDTDWLLVRAPDLDRALATLRQAGHPAEGGRGRGVQPD